MSRNVETCRNSEMEINEAVTIFDDRTAEYLTDTVRVNPLSVIVANASRVLADAHPESAPAEVEEAIRLIGDELRGDFEPRRLFNRGLLG